LDARVCSLSILWSQAGRRGGRLGRGPQLYDYVADRHRPSWPLTRLGAVPRVRGPVWSWGGLGFDAVLPYVVGRQTRRRAGRRAVSPLLDPVPFAAVHAVRRRRFPIAGSVYYAGPPSQDRSVRRAAIRADCRFADSYRRRRDRHVSPGQCGGAKSGRSRYGRGRNQPDRAGGRSAGRSSIAHSGSGPRAGRRADPGQKGFRGRPRKPSRRPALAGPGPPRHVTTAPRDKRAARRAARMGLAALPPAVGHVDTLKGAPVGGARDLRSRLLYPVGHRACGGAGGSNCSLPPLAPPLVAQHQLLFSTQPLGLNRCRRLNLPYRVHRITWLERRPTYVLKYLKNIML
jgi:hypothetical protein